MLDYRPGTSADPRGGRGARCSNMDDGRWRPTREPQRLDLLLHCGCYHAISFAGRVAGLDSEPVAFRFADVTAA
jgi:hypothetical protein